MKTLFRFVACLALLVPLSVVSASAQTYPNSTTLSASITATQTQIRLASGTGVARGGAVFIDQEYMDVQSCTTTACTTVNVTRVKKQAAHGSGAKVTVVSVAGKPQSMLTHNAAFRAGQCSTSTSSVATTALVPTLTGLTYLPIIDIDTGDFYFCRRTTGGRWEWVVTNVQGYNALDGSIWTAWP